MEREGTNAETESERHRDSHGELCTTVESVVGAADKPLPRFEYAQLREHGLDCRIRLLKIYPGADQHPVCCTLTDTRFISSYVHAFMKPACVERPTYIACSYVWGSEDGAEDIIVNGCQFRVRRNLHRMLKELRRTKQEGYLWIDAICIDQGSLVERSRQVSKMDDIFRLALSVISWLGESNPHFKWLADHLSRSFDSLTGHVTNDHENLASSPSSKQRVLDVIESIAASEYWDRIWIVQEIILGKETTLYSEGCVFQTPVLLHYIREHRSLTAKDPKAYLKTARLDRVLSLYDFDSEVALEDRTIESIFDKFGTAQCAMFHDKIFALCGLLQNKDPFRTKFTPDYAWSKKTLITNVLRATQGQAGQKFVQQPSRTRIRSRSILASNIRP